MLKQNLDMVQISKGLKLQQPTINRQKLLQSTLQQLVQQNGGSVILEYIVLTLPYLLS